MNVALLEAWIEEHNPNGATKLAAQADISPGTLYKILTGKHKTNLKNAMKIAKVLGVSLDALASDGARGAERPPAA